MEVKPPSVRYGDEVWHQSAWSDSTPVSAPLLVLRTQPQSQRELIDSAESKPEALAAIGRALWRELFTTIETEEQLADWESRIPRYDCDCYPFYTKWKSGNVPTFPLSFDWKYSLKSAVNAKLGVPNLTLPEARELWLGISQRRSLGIES